MIYSVLTGLAIALIFGVLIWIFTLHGTNGLFHIDILVRAAVIIVGCYGLILLGLTLGQRILALKGRSRIVRGMFIATFILAVLGIIFPFGIVGYATGFPSSAVKDVPPRLVLINNSASSTVPAVAVIENTSRPEQLSLSYEANGKRTLIHEDTASTQHIFLLSNLTPGTEYFYQNGDGNAYRFKTPEIQTAHLRFAAGGDAHFGSGDNRRDLTLKMAEYIADPVNSFDYFFSLGDLVDLGSSNTQWQDALNSLAPLTSTVPIGYVPGNHDVLFTGVDHYAYFCSPGGNPSPSGSPLYFRVDAGKIHFLVVDVEWSAESFNSRQAAWLEAQLKNIPLDDWKIVLSHGFYYSSGYNYHGWNWSDNPETISALTPYFEKYKVDMVFDGHLHQMELLQHSGVTYITCGALGGVLDPERTYVSPASLWYASGQFGFTDVSIDGNRASIIFRTPDHQILKEHVINKP
jgi:acid phosphatase type 7